MPLSLIRRVTGRGTFLRVPPAGLGARPPETRSPNQRDSTLRLAHDSDTSPVAHLTNEARALFDHDGAGTRRPGGIQPASESDSDSKAAEGPPGPGPGLLPRDWPVPHHDDPGPASALAPRATRIQGTYPVCTGTHARLLEEKCDLRRLAPITFLKLGGISHC